MKKIAQFIVEKRLWLCLIFVGLIAYCIFGVTKIEVEYDITTYLPDGTDTKQALKIMDEEFASSGSATVMIKNIEAGDANKLAAEINGINGVNSVSFDSSSKSNYNEGNALFNIFYAGSSSDKASVEAYNKTVKTLDDSGYTYTVPTPLVNNYAQTLASEMIIIIAISAAVIIAVLLFTSKSFAEVLAFPVVFAVAALLNMGTNYWLGKISFVSNTVCIILQLALAIDYAIILCHRFTEEKDKSPDPKTALITALSKAIPEIASSSLTTVAGLVALMFMQLGLGFDLGMVLAKSIVCSLLTVFLLMPCLLLWLTKLMDKTRHRSFVPKVKFLGAGVIKIRYVLVAVFVALFGMCAWLSQTITFCYSQNSIDTSRPTATMTAQREMEEVFGASNMFVILVPKTTDFDTQRELVATVSKEPLINSSLSWAAIALPSRTDENKSYYLTDEITAADLTDLTGVSSFNALMLFMMFASDNGDTFSAQYKVPITDLLEYVFSKPDILAMAGDGIAAYKDTLEFGKSQLVGKNHYRMVFNIAASVEAKETFDLIERLTPAVKGIEPKAIFAGSSMSAYDLNGSFQTDNLLITLLTIAFIFIILAITFRSWGIPIVLVAVIQGAIFINFTIPVMAGNNLFFFVYLIASAIQMGATIDYAILMTNRFMTNSATMPRREALINAITAAFPTILTSGTIMSIAAFLVGLMTSDPLIASMGMTLGFGTIISIVSVLTVLPALLYILGGLLQKTVLKRKKKAADLRMPNPSIPISKQ
ncbi:MAG: MMPL family transporter [Clostridiales bacterium]|nr:MMPL family transporter [Clostridiales bacterium]